MSEAERPDSVPRAHAGHQEHFDTPDIQNQECTREQLELKSTQNRSVTINQLPSEIFIDIFAYFHREHPRDPNGDNRVGGCYLSLTTPELGKKQIGWTKLMLVCRHWRNVALATPSLWRAIDVGKTSSNWMKLALIHSGGATVDISFHFDFTKEHVSLLLPHCRRLRSLRVRFWQPRALPVISNTFPALETLEICSNNDGARNGPSDLGITRERFPSLRHFRLAFAVVPLDTSFYAPLRRLTLVGCPFEATVEQFVELLAGCPGLEHLELEEFLQQLSSSENLGPPRSLPSLVSLHLYCHAPIHSTQLLSRIVAPSSSAELSVAARLYNKGQPEGTVRTSVPPDLANTLPSLTTFTWARLAVAFEHWALKGHPTKPGQNEIPLVVLSLLASWITFEWTYRMPDGLADLLSVFGAAPLTHLEVSGQCGNVEAGTWAMMFRTFPCLVSLEADAEGALFDGLRAAESPAGLAPDGSESDLPTLACRGLERISVLSYTNVLRTPEPLFEPLIECLRYRAEKGTRLKELHMTLDMRTDSVKGYLPPLKDLVSRVELKCTS